jgi:hypothetical protein
MGRVLQRWEDATEALKCGRCPRYPLAKYSTYKRGPSRLLLVVFVRVCSHFFLIPFLPTFSGSAPRSLFTIPKIRCTCSSTCTTSDARDRSVYKRNPCRRNAHDGKRKARKNHAREHKRKRHVMLESDRPKQNETGRVSEVCVLTLTSVFGSLLMR